MITRTPLIKFSLCPPFQRRRLCDANGDHERFCSALHTSWDSCLWCHSEPRHGTNRVKNFKSGPGLEIQPAHCPFPTNHHVSITALGAGPEKSTGSVTWGRIRFSPCGGDKRMVMRLGCLMYGQLPPTRQSIEKVLKSSPRAHHQINRLPR